MGSPPLAVIDSSALIDIKQKIPGEKQEDVWEALAELAGDGRIAFPRQVREELDRYGEEDRPLEWVRENRNFCEREVSYSLVKRVMPKIGDVIDERKEYEDADPYVVALALDSDRDFFSDPMVVTSDTRDRPHRIAMSTACERVNLEWCSLEDFLADEGIWTAAHD